MNEYLRGFDAGFSTALRHSDRHHHAFGSVASSEATKKISIGFHPEQFIFIRNLCKELDCSFAAAIREIVGRVMTSSAVSRPDSGGHNG